MLADKKTDQNNDENDFNFKWLDVKEEDEEDIALTNLIENYKGKSMRKIFKK